MKYPRFQRTAALPLLAMALFTAGCVINVGADQVVVKEEKQFTVGEGAELTLETFDGSIDVRSWNKPQVGVEIQKRGPDRETAAALEVRSTQDGNRVRIEAPSPKVQRESFGLGNVSMPSVSFVVHVPERLKLTATTKDGSISVSRINGKVALKSGDGSIKSDGITGELTAHTEDGSMRIVNVNGRVSVESGDGSIHVDGRVEGLHARTADGSIVIEAADGSAMKEDWDVATGDGSITVQVPDDFDAEIDADARDGGVQADMQGIDAVRNDNGRGTMRGKIGSGGHVVKLRSGDGSIRLLNR
jgi:DUF4097 and DUF4098 domain-containing protein YvlB